MDVAGVSDAGGYELYKNGVLEKIDYGKIERSGEIIEGIKREYMIPQYFTSRVILYNPEKIKTAPKSYADLWNPEFASKVGLIDIQYAMTMEAIASAFGGSVSNFEPAKAKLIELKKLGAKIYPTNEIMAQALKTASVGPASCGSRAA